MLMIVLKAVGSALLVAIVYVWGWYQRHVEEVSALVLRLEKERKDGWTNEEKEQFIVDVFFNEVLSELPAYWTKIPKVYYEKVIRWIIKGLCKKAQGVKTTVVTNIANKNK